VTFTSEAPLLFCLKRKQSARKSGFLEGTSKTVKFISFTGTFSLQTGFEVSETLISPWIPADKSEKLH